MPTPAQFSLLRKLNGLGWARPGQCLTSELRTPLGASNALKGLVRAGLVDHYTRYVKRGIRSCGGACLEINVYRITAAGIAAIAPAPMSPIEYDIGQL